MGLPLRRGDPRVPFRGRKESFTLNGASSNPRAHSNQPFSHFFFALPSVCFFFFLPTASGRSKRYAKRSLTLFSPSINFFFFFLFFLFFLTQHPRRLLCLPSKFLSSSSSSKLCRILVRKHGEEGEREIKIGVPT